MNDNQISALGTAEQHSRRGWELLACLWMARQCDREKRKETNRLMWHILEGREAAWVNRAYRLMDDMEAELPEVVARLETLAFDMDQRDGGPPGGEAA